MSDWADKIAEKELPCYCGGNHVIIGQFHVDTVKETETFERYAELKTHTTQCPVELRDGIATALRDRDTLARGGRLRPRHRSRLQSYSGVERNGCSADIVAGDGASGGEGEI